MRVIKGQLQHGERVLVDYDTALPAAGAKPAISHEPLRSGFLTQVHFSHE